MRKIRQGLPECPLILPAGRTFVLEASDHIVYLPDKTVKLAYIHACAKPHIRIVFIDKSKAVRQFSEFGQNSGQVNGKRQYYDDQYNDYADKQQILCPFLVYILP